MIKAIIFDLDGVIVSTDNLHFRAWSMIANEEGIFFDKEINNKLRGVSRMESLNIILDNSSKAYKAEEKNELAKRKNEIYVSMLDSISSSDILPGISELLESARRKGLKLAIGSSSRNAKKILSRIGLTDSFDAVSDGTNITNSKPHPEVFLEAARMLALESSECVVVEDALSGIEAAYAAEMISFATGDAITSELKNYDLSEIYEILNIERRK